MPFSSLSWVPKLVHNKRKCGQKYMQIVIMWWGHSPEVQLEAVCKHWDLKQPHLNSTVDFFFFLIIISIIILISPYLYFVIGLLSDLYCGQTYAFLIVCFFCFWFGKRLNLDWEGCNPRPKKCLQCNCMSSRGRMLMQYHRRCVSVRWPWKKKYLLILKTGRKSYEY